jgi:hypothetical protein
MSITRTIRFTAMLIGAGAWLGQAAVAISTDQDGFISPAPQIALPSGLASRRAVVGDSASPPQLRTVMQKAAPATGAPPQVKTNSAGVARLRAGVYETIPYTSVVIVPAPNVDDRSVIPWPRSGLASTGNGKAPMPIIKPELQFIPRTGP